MKSVLLSIALMLASQDPPTSKQEGKPESGQEMQGYVLYSTAVKVDAGYADDLVKSGLALLYYRAAFFASEFGGHTPETAIRAATTCIQIPDVKRLGEDLNVGPVETEVKPKPNAEEDRQWFLQRSSELMRRDDLQPVVPMIQDQSFPLPGRVRIRVLSEQDREAQINDRVALFLTTLATCRGNAGKSWKPDEKDAAAARESAEKQFERDFARFGDRWVSMRGRAAKWSRGSFDDAGRVVLEWIGPALKQVEGVKHLGIAPANDGWVVIDTDSGWSLRDPIFGRFSDRDLLLIQKGFRSGASATREEGDRQMESGKVR